MSTSIRTAELRPVVARSLSCLLLALRLSSPPAEAQNLLVNPELDGSMAGWNLWGVGASYVATDHDACVGSGAVRIEGDPAEGVGVFQNNPWPSGWERAWLGLRVRLVVIGPPPFEAREEVDSPRGEPLTQLYPTMRFYPTVDCSGPADLSYTVTLPASELGEWSFELVGPATVPPGTLCVATLVRWFWSGDENTTVEIDGLVLGGSQPLFLDGFESPPTASLCRWETP
jgi:hypothetical protein